MADESDIDETIAAIAAGGVASATVDGNSATALSIDDLIKARKHVAGTNTTNGMWGRVTVNRWVPPGADPS